jgi:hypothetical protein
MSGEVYQAQVLRNFFDTITGTDRNLTRIYMCVLSDLELTTVQTAFGVKDVSALADDFAAISLDSL